MAARRFLFYKPDLAWPRQSGHDVHTFNMMRALTKLGAKVGLVTSTRVHPDAVAGVDLSLQEVIAVRELEADRRVDPPLRLTAAQERFRSYWGTSREAIVRFGAVAQRFHADVVVVSGLYEILTDDAAVRASLAGIRALLPPGGLIVLTGQPRHPQLRFIAGVLTHRDGRPWIMRPRPVHELERHLTEAGFVDPHTTGDSQAIFTITLARSSGAAAECV